MKTSLFRWYVKTSFGGLENKSKFEKAKRCKSSTYQINTLEKTMNELLFCILRNDS